MKIRKNKVVFILLFSTWLFNGLAQSVHSDTYIIEAENLDKSVRYDTLSWQMSGRRFVLCVIPDQFEIIQRDSVDSRAYTQKRVLSYVFTPPQYDSLLETIELHPAYSFYDIDEKAKLPKGAVLIPPTWKIAVKQVMIDTDRLKVARFKGLEMGVNDDDCFGFVAVEAPKKYLNAYQRSIKTAALLIQKVGNQTVVDTLKLPSPYLRETKVAARYLQKTTYFIKKPMKIKVLSSSPIIPNNITGVRLLRAGGLSEFREYIVCGGTYGPTIKAIQKSLRHLGYWVRINDKMDNRTKRALTAFQKRHYLPVGNLNLETLTALNVERFIQDNERIRDNKIEDFVKTVSFGDIDSLNNLITLEALPDEQIALMTHTDIKKIKGHRKLLKIKEVKRQVILFGQ